MALLTTQVEYATKKYNPDSERNTPASEEAEEFEEVDQVSRRPTGPPNLEVIAVLASTEELSNKFIETVLSYLPKLMELPQSSVICLFT